MTHTFDGFNYVVRLDKGELLIEHLTALVRQEELQGAWISGLGAAQWVELGFYQLEAQTYHWQRLDKLLEITALSGNVAWKDDEPVLHIHGSFADEQLRGYGGHVKELAVGGTCEVFLHRMQGDTGLVRQHNDQIGLDLLQL